jgi:hypothetical protein
MHVDGDPLLRSGVICAVFGALRATRERATGVGLSRLRSFRPDVLSARPRPWDKSVPISTLHGVARSAGSARYDITACRLRQNVKKPAQSQAATFLIVTHSIDEAIFLANRILVSDTPARLRAEIPRRIPGGRAVSDQLKEQVRTLIFAAAGLNLFPTEFVERDQWLKIVSLLPVPALSA